MANRKLAPLPHLPLPVSTARAREKAGRASLAYPERLYVPVLDAKGHESGAAEVALDLTEYGVPVELLEIEFPAEIIAELSAAAA